MPTRNGRTAFIELLLDEGITHLFGNPGTTELAIMEAVPSFPQLQFVLGLQEAVVLGMADGFARASGRLAVANVHVAPGLGNALGALFNAKFSGSPIIVCAGQQEQGHGLLEPMLYEPLVPLAQPLVKWAIEVARAADLPRIVRRAAKVALTPPAGPVFISLPGDVLDQTIDIDLGHAVRVDLRVRPAEESLQRLAETVLAARRPVIIAGQEVAARDAFAEVGELAELIGAPVFGSSVPHNAQFTTEHPAYMGVLLRQQQRVRALLEPFDLLICLGAELLRMSVPSPVEPLPPGLPVVHVSERGWELGKNYRTDLAIQASVKETVRALLPLLRDRRSPEAAARFAALQERNWSAQRAQAAAEAMKTAAATPIDPRYLMLCISEHLPPDSIVVEEGLISSLSLPSFLRLRDARSFYGLASGGLGFAMPGAIGISLALPGRPVFAVVGDGSAMYSIQALWTAAHLKLPVTYLIANNRSYRILKERLVSMRATDRFVGMDIREPAIDFVGLAQALGVAARRVRDPNDLVPALREGAAAGGPRLIDVAVADGFGA